MSQKAGTGLRLSALGTPLSFSSDPVRRVSEYLEALDHADIRRDSRYISVDYFDPAGIEALTQSLKRESQGSGSTENEEFYDAASVLPPSLDSEATLDDGQHLARILRYYLKKRDEAAIQGRQLGVAFENLRVVGRGAAVSYQPTLGSVLNPWNIVRRVLNARRPQLREILHRFEGVVRPSEMLLVLGRPGSGCSTFLKVLANHRDEYHSVDGHVYYDTLKPRDIAKHYRGDVLYCPEEDILFPTLTVDQTVHFAAKTRAPRRRVENITRSEYTRKVTDILLTTFGLNHVKDTLVGDAAIRGVSGGEKKRVSISETLATRSRITSWDNTTKGLDASTALEFARALRIATDLVKNSTIVSIYQAAKSLYDVFDKVCLIYEGRMAYYGPASLARQYFIDMGYVPVTDRQTTPDFLVSVTDPAGRIAVTKDNDRRSPNRRGKPIPRTAAEFEEYFSKSEVAAINREDINRYKAENVNKLDKATAYQRSAVAEHAQHTRPKSPYTISLPMQVRIVMLRRIQMTKGNLLPQILQTTIFVLQAIILGTTFVKIPDATSAYFSRGGVIFFSVFAPALFSMSEIPGLFAQRPVILRHQKAAMYHPMVEALAMTLVDIPFTVITMILFSVIVYFIVKLQQTASQFFIYFLFIITVAISMKAFFRALAAAFPKAAPAQAFAGVMVLALTLYTGYTIPRPSMIGALRWISYINPIRYAFDGMMTNEFHTLNAPCSNLVPSGPGYEGVSLANQVCAVVGAQPGQSTVNGNVYLALSFNYYHRNLWRNFGITVAFGVGFVFCLLFFTELNVNQAGQGSKLLFRRGARMHSSPHRRPTPLKADIESDQSTVMAAPVARDSEAGNSQSALADQPKMQNIFSWKYIRYTVVVAGQPKILLDDVSGFVAPGKLTALMGESGAGKTTLLNVLADRAGVGIVEGGRYFNGQGLPDDFQGQTGYCQQVDTHVSLTTVREALRFSARLRQPACVPTAEKDAYADKCLQMCELEPFADAIVGSLGVEQKKRTTIGVELAAKPKLLLFLDEPTSGLDSQSAWAIVSFLRTLADNGQAILCTIHQPSAELFFVFDRLLLLRKGGRTVYFGDVGKEAHTIINYFEAGGGRRCQPDENPAEYMLDVIGAGATASSNIDWYEVWLNSAECMRLEKDIERIHYEGQKQPPVGAAVHSQFATPWRYQTWELIKRQHLVNWRDPTYLVSKLFLNIVSGLFIGFTFFKAKNTIQGTQNKLFAIFMSVILSAPLAGQLHVPHIKMRDVSEIRERASRTYHWAALTTSQLLMELPWNILGSTLYFFCWYWTVGFESSRGGYTYLMYGLAFPIYYTTAALAVAGMAPTAEIASLVFAFLFTFVLTFDGVVQPFRELGWWKWMYHLSPFTYLIEGLLGQAIGGQLINCSNEELVVLQPPSGQTCGVYMASYISRAGGYLTDYQAISDCHFCSSRTTDEWMGPSFNIYYRHHWRDFGLFCAYIAFNVFALYLLTYAVRVRSHHLVKDLWKRFTTRHSRPTES